MYIENLAEFARVLFTTTEMTFDIGWLRIQLLLFCQLATITTQGVVEYPLIKTCPSVSFEILNETICGCSSTFSSPRRNNFLARNLSRH